MITNRKDIVYKIELVLRFRDTKFQINSKKILNKYRKES